MRGAHRPGLRGCWPRVLRTALRKGPPDLGGPCSLPVALGKSLQGLGTSVSQGWGWAKASRGRPATILGSRKTWGPGGTAPSGVRWWLGPSSEAWEEGEGAGACAGLSGATPQMPFCRLCFLRAVQKPSVPGAAPGILGPVLGKPFLSLRRSRRF